MPLDPSAGIFNFKVFISYKSQQESWARRLAVTLRSFGISVWRDHDTDEGGIRLGEEWSDEIRRGIRDSEKAVVFWSNLIATNASSVVHREVTEMENYIANDASGKRGFVPISLDGTSFANYPALAPYQGDFSEFRRLWEKYGDAGAETVSSIEWYEAIKPLVEALGLDQIMEVRFVCAAMTRTQAIELRDDPSKRINSQAFDLMLGILNKTSGFDIERYGTSPDDWKPFPQLAEPWTIREIIEAYDKAKRDWQKERREPAKWIVVSYSDEIVSSNPVTRRQAHEAITDLPCLVIVDPLSVMHRDVFHQIIVGGGLQHHSKAFFIGVAPFISFMHDEIYSATYQVWETLKDQGFLGAAYERFSSYFEPYNRASVLDIENQYQFMRWLQIAGDSIITAKQTPMRPFQRSSTVQNRTMSNAPRKPSPPSTIVRLMMSTDGN